MRRSGCSGSFGRSYRRLREGGCSGLCRKGFLAWERWGSNSRPRDPVRPRPGPDRFSQPENNAGTRNRYRSRRIIWPGIPQGIGSSFGRVGRARHSTRSANSSGQLFLARKPCSRRSVLKGSLPCIHQMGLWTVSLLNITGNFFGANREH